MRRSAAQAYRLPATHRDTKARLRGTRKLTKSVVAISCSQRMEFFVSFRVGRRPAFVTGATMKPRVGGGVDAPPGKARARRGRGSAKSPAGDSSRRRIRGRALALAIALTLHKYLVAPHGAGRENQRSPSTGRFPPGAGGGGGVGGAISCAVSTSRINSAR